MPNRESAHNGAAGSRKLIIVKVLRPSLNHSLCLTPRFPIFCLTNTKELNFSYSCINFFFAITDG